VLLGVTGSVAAIKAPMLCEQLLRFADVRVVLTSAARHFLPPNAAPYGGGGGGGGGGESASAPADGGADADADAGDPLSAAFPPPARPVLLDAHEWRDWRRVGDPVAHIELRRWADCLVVAPLSANTLSKLASGACDNLLTCVARAWDVGRPPPPPPPPASPPPPPPPPGGAPAPSSGRPVLVAPAMNTCMWESPFTARHLRALGEVFGGGGGGGAGGGGGGGFCVVPPVAKALACGDVGSGAMAAPEDVARAVARALRRRGFGGEEVARAAGGAEEEEQEEEEEEGRRGG
jgi:phosphopantothenoylcysteine decarboxylase